MSARPRHQFFRPLHASRRNLGVVALGLLTVAGLLIPVEGAAVAAEKPPHHVSTDLERAIENGTVEADLKSGRVTEDDILKAGEDGLTLHGHHTDGWTDPTAAQRAKGEEFAAQLRADPSLMQVGGDSLDMGHVIRDMSDPTAVHPRAVTSPADASLDGPAGPPALAGAAGITDSKHWWNGPRDWLRKHTPHVYLNGPWFKAIVAAGVGAAMAGVCAFFDFSKMTCILVGAVIVAAIELVKNTKCGRNGIHLYWPIWMTWLSYC